MDDEDFDWNGESSDSVSDSDSDEDSDEDESDQRQRIMAPSAGAPPAMRAPWASAPSAGAPPAMRAPWASAPSAGAPPAMRAPWSSAVPALPISEIVEAATRSPNNDLNNNDEEVELSALFRRLHPEKSDPREYPWDSSARVRRLSQVEDEDLPSSTPTTSEHEEKQENDRDGVIVAPSHHDRSPSQALTDLLVDVDQYRIF